MTTDVPSKGNSVSEFDCRPPTPVKTALPPSPEIDYLARDFASFRRLMLDRLTSILPDWQERNPSDIGMAMVEVLAYAADQLSYHQDAVANEAYLGTARQRISIRRHARLVDYIVHEGCNARVWVHVQVYGNVLLKKGTQLLTLANVDSINLSQASAEGVDVFETMHPAQLFEEHNEMHFYIPEDNDDLYLPKGSTQANIDGDFPNLKSGDILIFEEKLGEAGGNPNHRHVVRLVNVIQNNRPQKFTTIEWHAQDALPFDLHLAHAVVRGNIVLADHGQTLTGEVLSKVPRKGIYRPYLENKDLTFATPYNEATAQTQAASTILFQDPRAALPSITLNINGEIWSARGDLLSSDRFACDFTVEVDNAGRAYLRFGDGIRGKRPPADATPIATYRNGNGINGNIAQEVIGHVVTTENQIASVCNLMPARGGSRPEPIEQVRLHAPQAFRTQERCVTAADYVEAAQRHPEVDRAAAMLQWTGAWHTMFITLDRKSGRPVDTAFKIELRTFLERFRLAGYDLEICAPHYLPLDIALIVHVASHAFRASVNQTLLEAFSDVVLPDGSRGFFHPDNFTFGQSVYLSQIIATAMHLPGVEWVETLRFKKQDRPAGRELEEARIEVGPLEIARLDNDPDARENGRIEFILEGGL